MDTGSFTFSQRLQAHADKCLNNATICELWCGFCAHAGTLVLEDGQPNTFLTEGMEPPTVPDGSEFAIRVTEWGIAVSGKDYPGLARGLMVLMMHIEAVNLEEGKEQFRIAPLYLESGYTVEKRMIHFCVFPETSGVFLKKLIRLAGAMQYTHVLLEYWGMLQFDCLKELAWPQAFSKDFAKAVSQEISDMGMKAIPMINHLGHASGCRVKSGKHVVLDQNPRLAVLFSPDGWSWNVDNPRVKQLLRQVRRELYEIYPEAEYFHLGCDEVDSYDRGEANQRKMRTFLKEIIEDVKSEGKKPIIWGDMLLNRENVGLAESDEGYCCFCDSPEDAKKLIDAIPKDTVIADWHYDVYKAPVKTSVYFKEQGFEVLGAPWFEYANCQAHFDTIREYKLHGLMVTTWHTLAERISNIVSIALICGAIQSPWSDPRPGIIRLETATLLRKLYFADGNYREAGWTETQIFQQAT